MITVDQKGSYIQATIFGEFTLADFEEFKNIERYAAGFSGAISLLVDLRQMAGFTIDVVWEEVKFVKAHGGDLKRVAVITDSQWVTWSAWLSRMYSAAEVSVFSELDEAQAWLSEDEFIRTIVTAEELLANLDEWRVIDCRFDLSNPAAGAAAYAAGHISGALYFDIDKDLSGPKNGSNGRHPLPDPDKLVALFSASGIDADTQVVAYDNSGGMFAARLWWLLRWLGHERVAVLDGGLSAWSSLRAPLVQEIDKPSPRRFTNRLQQTLVDADYVKAFLHTSEMFLLDARSPDRFRGENETIDAVAGHIPGALNRFYQNNLDARGLFKAPDLLREEFDSLLGLTAPQSVVCSCGSGITACHNLLAMEIAGLSGAKLYAGSWSEWCSDPSRPVATGEA